MDLNSLIYYEFNNIDSYIFYFKNIGVFDFIKSRSYRSEIKNLKKKLQINVIIDFINYQFSLSNNNIFDLDFVVKDILKNYSKYLFLYELLKKGE